MMRPRGRVKQANGTMFMLIEQDKNTESNNGQWEGL